jgi:hypothetical protein
MGIYSYGFNLADDESSQARREIPSSLKMGLPISVRD